MRGILDAPPKAMRTLLVAALLFTGCRERVATDDDRVSTSKPVEHDDDFVQTRASFQTRMRARLEQLNAEIRDLGDDASVRLRAERDELALRIEKIDEQGEMAWDAFREELEGAFDDVERELRSH